MSIELFIQKIEENMCKVIFWYQELCIPTALFFDF